MIARLSGALPARALSAAVWLAASIGGAGSVLAQSGEYRVQPGDIVGVIAAGLQDTEFRASVQLDGQVTFPYVGGFDTSGMTISQLQVLIQSAFASRVFPLYTADGQQIMRTIGRDQVAASIVEYRPIFIGGDVVRQGEHAFRPGLTVRQALAAAGGAILAGPRVPLTGDPTKLRADYLRAWYAAAATEARLWRLRAEMGATEPFAPALPPAPGSESKLDRFVELETDLRDARELDHQRQREFLESTLEQIDAQADVLRRQLEAEKGSEKIDADNLEAATRADSEVLYTQSRQARLGNLSQLSDIRAAALISSTRRLQTESNLMQLERRKSEIARDLQSLQDRHNMDLIAEISAEEIRSAEHRATLDEVYEKLQVGGIVAEATGQPQPAPHFVIVRGDGAIRGCLDDGLQPGDVVEVSLPAATAVAPPSGLSESCPVLSAVDPQVLGN